MPTTKRSSELTLFDRLSRLTMSSASKLLGDDGNRLIMRGGQTFDIDLDEDVYIGPDLLRVKFPTDDTVTTLNLMAEKRNRLNWNCTKCDDACEHVGAMLSMVLEDKTALGLASAPPEREPVKPLSEGELILRAIEERSERADTEKMKLKSASPSEPWTDYTITSGQSGKTYSLTIRGEERGQAYCSCPDFRKNTLGTCKHIMNALGKIQRKFSKKARSQPYEPTEITVHLQFGEGVSIAMDAPSEIDKTVAKLIKPFRSGTDDIHALVSCIGKLQSTGQDIVIYPDAEEFIQQRLFQDRIRDVVADVRKDPKNHPLRKELLNAELLPYQLDGIAFVVGAGRAILADDMGLGKTIQGIGTAELFAKHAGISKVLVICPASLKSQWRNEVHRFCDRSVQLVIGSATERATQYMNDAFFTVCNYEQVLRDITAIERTRWDLIILDEGQRIKNWEAKTSNVVKSLRSPFALVLTGTPLENRLDDLFSVVEFIDDRRLAPAFRFFNHHRVTDDRGKVLGYRNLDDLRNNLKPILLRRTRGSVMQQLPGKTTEVVRIPPTKQQSDMHEGHIRTVRQIVCKKYLTEMDLLRLQKALLLARMSADSTFLLTKEDPSYSSKLERLEELLVDLFQEDDRKVVLFSEWTTMLNLIEKQLKKHNLNYVRLDGSVPQKKRQQLVHKFQNDPECQLFITTNAGSTGLNLQAANTVINVDLPWNPAVLEQRIARAHRMGQKRPVQVYILVTEHTIEESMLHTLSAKHTLSLAALDFDSDVTEVQLTSGMEELKSRMEVLLGALPEDNVNESERVRVEEQHLRQRKERVSEAGGQLVGAAFNFLNQMLPDTEETDTSRKLTNELVDRFKECTQEDESGRVQLTVTLPDASAIEGLAASLSKLLTLQGNE